MSHFPISFMSRAAVQTIAVGAAGAAWLVRSDTQKLQMHSVAWQEQQTAAQAIESLVSRLSVAQSSGLQWVVAPSLLKHWLQQPPDQIQSLSELHAVTRQRALQLFGNTHSLNMNEDASWVVDADWHASQAFLCGAMPSGWHSALMGNESSQDVNFASNKAYSFVNPLQLVIARFRKQFPSDGWLSVVVANTLYLMFFKNTKYIHLRSLKLKTVSSTVDIQTVALVEWQRDKLRTQLNSEQLHWLCFMPIVAASNVSSALLKPLQWAPANTTDMHEAESKTSLGSKNDLHVELSEVKLTAWCALQCGEKQL